jgi:hypothetical protein
LGKVFGSYLEGTRRLDIRGFSVAFCEFVRLGTDPLGAYIDLRKVWVQVITERKVA